MAKRTERDPFVQALNMLRSHLVGCYACRNAQAVNDPDAMCLNGLGFVFHVAKECTKLFAMKRQAVSTINDYVYACPDIASHGEAFALTAQPLSVVAAQEELF